MIKVFDNFLPKEELNKINELLERPMWSFTGGGVSDDDSFTSRMWHMDNLEKDDYFVSLFYLIKDKLKINGQLLRCYANGQTATQSGVPHKDDGDTTILYFPTPWAHYIGGHLHFYGEGLTDTIEYKQNRLVLFPANLTHYAGAPDKTYRDLRVSLAFKVKNE